MYSRTSRFKYASLAAIAVIVMALMPSAAIAADAASVQELITEAEQLRAAEFSPSHYAEAKKLLAEGRNTEAAEEARKAIASVQTLTERFSGIVEARDRMQLSGAEQFRADLTSRAEEQFASVVAAVEEENLSKAEQEAKLARLTTQQAMAVAARETYVRPITKGIASARKVSARTYSPKALAKSVDAQKDIEKLIKENPESISQAHKLSKDGADQAKRAENIGNLGTRISKNPEALEGWVDAADARMMALGEALGVQLSWAQSPDEQAERLKQAIEDQRNTYMAQLADSEAQIRDLSAKLAKYEGEVAEMQEMRHKLQLKREAEAKIKRLAKLFNRDEVEVLLTTEADVILRMKKLNFRSGSAVIPPDTYDMLDHAVESISLFAGRKVRVEGHTDSVGSNDYNQSLSERRAASVLGYLKERIAGNTNTESVGFGEEKPIANNETAKGREKNRRIDIVLIAPQQ